MKGLVASIESQGLRPRLWYSPLSVAPGADLLHDHPDMLLLDKDGALQIVSWWNTFYLCPAYSKTIENTQGAGSKIHGRLEIRGPENRRPAFEWRRALLQPGSPPRRPERFCRRTAELFPRHLSNGLARSIPMPWSSCAPAAPRTRYSICRT